MTNAIKSIPFARPDISSLEIEAVSNVLKSGWLTSGPEIEKFETEFSKEIQASCSVAVNSCTSALHLALVCHGLGPGDAVILPAITFIASAEAIIYTGALPIIVDVDPQNYLLTPGILEDFIRKQCKIKKNILIHKKSGRKIKAVMPVHIGGRPCDLLAIHAIIKKYKIPLVDDCAHAYGAAIGKNKIGSDALPQAISCFSFYATKNITTGEGGMMTFANRKLLEKVRYLRLHGIRGQTYGRQRWKYNVVMQGYKYNLCDFAAAMGRVQMSRHPEMMLKRQMIAQRYDKEFINLPGLFIDPVSSFESAYHLYTIHLGSKKRRDKFVDMMFDSGIAVSLHFIPLYRHKFWKKEYGDKPGDFKGSEYAYKGMVSLPIYSNLAEHEIIYIIKTIQSIVRKGLNENSREPLHASSQ